MVPPPNGSVITRESLICTRLTIEDIDGNQTSQTPKPDSKQSKKDQALVEELELIA